VALTKRTALLAALAALGALALACRKEEPPKPKRTEPWPAPAHSGSAAPQAATSAPVRYAIASESRVSFELPAREAKPKGAARLVRGEITLYPAELARTSAVVEVDLGSIVIDSEDGTSQDKLNTERALSWLNIGSSRPEAERERLRWAKFELTSLEDLWSSSVQAGKRMPVTAAGRLSLNGFRVPARAALEFFASDESDGSGAPRELSIRTRQPFVVSLSSHDIQPRDSHGVLLAQELKLLGTRVGDKARVTLELKARRR
jgi:hypothetical protein